MAATRYQPEDMPLRLYYVGNVFRYAEPQAGRYREFTQVGVELIGAAGPRADAEVVAVAAGVLESLGLRRSAWTWATWGTCGAWWRRCRTAGWATG